MTWATEKQEQGNLGNYESALADLKEQIAVANKEIARLIEQKDSLLSGNQAFLKDKATEADKKIEEAHKLFDEARKTLDDANQKNETARIYLADVDKHHNNLNDRKIDFINEVKKITQEIDDREAQIKHEKGALALRETTQKDLEESFARDVAAHNAVVDEHQNAIKDLEDRRSELDKTTESLLEKSKKVVAEKDEAIRIRDEHLDNYEKFKAERDEVRSKHEEISNNLLKIVQEQARINEMIIESKRVALEARKQVQAAQKAQVEAQQKIAELNDLKTELAKMGE